MMYRALAFAVAMLAISGTAAKASNILINGGFEGGFDPGAYTTYGAGDIDLTGWTINSGSVDHIGTYWQPAEGSRSLDLAGNGPGEISQTFATKKYQQYLVSFSIAGNPDGEPIIKQMASWIDTGITVFNSAVTYTFDDTGTTKANMGWLNFSYSFIADSTSATLYFASLVERSPYGPALDNVSVSAVPLPAALPLFASGLAGLGLLGKRRRKAVAQG